MKRFFLPFFLLTVSIALITSSFSVILIQGISQIFTSSRFEQTIFGCLVFSALNFTYFHFDELLMSNRITSRSAVFSLFYGGFVGAFIFFTYSFYSDFLSLSTIQKWSIGGSLISSYYLIKNTAPSTLMRGILCSVIASLSVGLLNITAIPEDLKMFFSSLLYISTFLLLNRLIKESTKKRYLKSLNGWLIGFEFSLDESDIIAGSQASDDIILKNFDDVQPSQVKLVRYDKEFSIVDNDATGNTFVNFRSIHEQLLKNGDIIKVGSSLLQYCVKS